MNIEEKVIIAFSKHRMLSGILHEGLYKSWSEKLITQFTDDYKYLEEEDYKKKKKDEFSITGSMNSLFPKILAKLAKDSKTAQVNYIAAVTDNVIQPFRLNILHFLSYYNNSNALFYAIKYGGKYARDSLGNTPL